MNQFTLFIILLIFMGGFFIGKKGLVLILVWVLIEGAVRKWLLPSSYVFVFFVSHIILGGLYLRFFGGRIINKLKIFPEHPINRFLIIVFCWGVLEALNPNLPNRLIGLLGLTVYFYYVPISFMVEQAFNSKEKIFNFLKFYSFLSIPLFLLGIIQFFSSAFSPLNVYLGEKKLEIAIIGEHARITSTFPYISGYGTYLSFIIPIFIYLLSTKKLSKRMTLFLYLALSLAMINMFMTGSRGPMGIVIISTILYLCLSGIISFRLLMKIFLIITLSSMLIVFILSFTYFGREAFSTFMERVTGSEDVVPRLIDTYTPFKFLKEAGIYGFGIGSTYQGAETLAKDLDWKGMPRDFEEEPERIVLELGLIGYILVYLLRFLYLKSFWSLSKRLKDRDLKLLSLILFLFQLQYFHFNVLAFNLTASIFYWFSIGFLFLLPKLDYP